MVLPAARTQQSHRAAQITVTIRPSGDPAIRQQVPTPAAPAAITAATTAARRTVCRGRPETSLHRRSQPSSVRPTARATTAAVTATTTRTRTTMPITAAATITPITATAATGAGLVETSSGAYAAR